MCPGCRPPTSWPPHKDALQYLPEGADVNALTWEQLGEWCKNIYDKTGKARCGFPHAGLFHRFLEGYMWPSFTGGMVTNFKSAEAADDARPGCATALWPYVNPQSISYELHAGAAAGRRGLGGL